MKLIRRISRHVRISIQGLRGHRVRTPPFLVLFINSVCNLKCEHCFYWRSLNRKDDLTCKEILAFANEYGPFENLNLSGGEPFLRGEMGEICRHFIRNNRVKRIYVPTNAFYPEKIRRHVEEILKEPSLELLVIEISLDGMPEYHDKFRGDPQSFEKAMESYRVLEDIQRRDGRLRLHATSTVTNENLEEIRALTDVLHDRCPSMEHHGIALIRGERKNKELEVPELASYRLLWRYVATRWRDRESSRYGSVVEPMLQWAKCKTVTEKQQVIPCLAGILSAVVYANGDVSVCEHHEPLGNLRQKSFFEIWDSAEAGKLRRDIGAKSCYCTNEIFLWPSIVFQPLHLLRSMIGSRVWKSI